MKNPVTVIIAIIFLAAFFGSGSFGYAIPAIIIYFVIRSMRKKQNPGDRRQFPPQRRRDYDPYKRPQRRETDFERQREYRRPAPQPRKRPSVRSKPNPYKKTGVDKYKEYDYDGAIQDFKKALEINPNDIPTLFNIACAYSLTEQKEQAYIHISKAVDLGFKDFNKIKTHDAFAYIRVQDDFEQFEKNGFRWSARQSGGADQEDLAASVDPNLLEKLKRLAELRDRGILTEAEFVVQKEKLLR